MGRLEDVTAAPPPAASPGAETKIAGDGGLGIDDDLLAALRSRRDAFAEVVAADRPAMAMDVSEPSRTGKANDDPDAQLLAELKEAHRRVQMRVVDPIQLLKKQIIKPINTGVVKTHIAPTYLVWLYNQNNTLVLYFENFFCQKGLAKTQLYTDSMRIASESSESGSLGGKI